ncbi:MAG: beta-lactamase family protein [Halieaceae bacterium]|nr:beta-lactamase family protein [Halieaceae bacterium]
MEQRLQTLIEDTVGDAPGVMLAINAPFQDLHFSGAAGEFCRGTETPLEPGHSFRIASMSKTFTGTLCAQLMEEGLLSADAAIGDLLPSEIAACIPVIKGHTMDEITIDLLLQHRAGFNDFALSPEWFTDISSDPGRFREPTEIALWALNYGEPVAAPGETYHYSDTGFVLLGLALEQLAGTPYRKLCRERIFNPLKMNDSYLEGHEEHRGALSHPYVVLEGEYIDALQVNGSCDWAAGGHVSTLKDIDAFLRGLFNQQLFRETATLDQFLKGRLAKPKFSYGMGVGRKQIHGKTLWGHLGHWGSFMYYCPEERLSLCGTLNYSEAPHNEFIEQVLQTLYS